MDTNNSGEVHGGSMTQAQKLSVDIEVRDQRIFDIIEEKTELEELATGFQFLEGPIWHPYEQHLTFSDIMGNRLYRWREHEGLSIFRHDSHMANGNTYDRQGHILTCEHASSCISRTSPDGHYEVLVTHYQGKALNSPNDLVVKTDGSIYFTDPVYGRSEPFGVARAVELPFEGVYCFNPEDSSLRLLVDDFAGPNGLCFSRDERQLFVNDTERKHIRVFEVTADGSLTNGRVWAETTGEADGIPDGMKINQAGQLFCTGPGGIHVFDMDAHCLGVIGVPPTANFAWGDKDLRSLFLTSVSTLYRIRLKLPGLQLF
jgi:gluconolactonase